MNRYWSTLILLVALSYAAITAEADDAYSGVAGYIEKDCAAGADTRLSVPFERELLHVGELKTVGVADDQGIQLITVEGLDSLTPDDLADVAFVRFIEGASSGQVFAVNGNTDSELGVNFGSASPSPGTVVSVSLGWTLDELFPPATQTAFHESTGKFRNGRGSELMILSSDSSTGKVSSARVFFIDGGAWVEAGSDFAEAGDTLLPHDAVLVVRHPSSEAATTASFAGTSLGGDVGSVIKVKAGRVQSHAIGLLNAAPVRLSDLTMASHIFVPSRNASASLRRDVLHVFENSSTTNPDPSASYIRVGANWIKLEAGFPASNGDKVPAGGAIVIQSAPSTSDKEVLWVQP